MLHQYPTHSDLPYGDVTDTTMPQGGTQWGSGRPDASQTALNSDSDDRQRVQQIRASQYPSNYSPATTYSVTSRDSFPAQAQSHCSGQYPYPSQPYQSVAVNYSLPPYDFAEYPVSASYPCDQTEYSPRHPSDQCSQCPPRWAVFPPCIGTNSLSLSSC